MWFPGNYNGPKVRAVCCGLRIIEQQVQSAEEKVSLIGLKTFLAATAKAKLILPYYIEKLQHAHYTREVAGGEYITFYKDTCDFKKLENNYSKFNICQFLPLKLTQVVKEMHFA